MLVCLNQGYILKEIQEQYHRVPLATFEGALDELAQQVGETSMIRTLSKPKPLLREDLELRE
jgi:hypothetical protein